MTFKTYDINIDLVNESSTTSTIHFSTNDRNAAKLLLTITNKGAELDLSQAKSVRISFKKPDGTRVFQNDCLPINVLKGKYQIVLNTQTLAVEGYVYAQVHIEEEDKTIDTQKFFFVVNESLASDEAFESTNEYGVAQKIMEAGEKFVGVDIDALIDSKETAEQAKVAAEQNANQIGILSENVGDKADKTYVDAELTKKATQSDLIAKADTTYVDNKVSAVASGSPKGTYTTLAALQTAKPTGDNNIYLVTADGKWYYWNGTTWTAGGTYQSTGIANSSVTPDKTTFIKVSGNMFNKNDSDIKNDKRVSSSEGGDTAVFVNSSVSGFIPITNTETYSYNMDAPLYGSLTTYALYDTNKSLLEIKSGTLSGDKTFITVTIANANAKFIRTNVSTKTLSTFMFCKGTSLKPYEDYGSKMEEGILLSKSQKNDVVNLIEGKGEQDKENINLLLPKNVYVTCNDITTEFPKSRQYSSSLYLDHTLVNKIDENLVIIQDNSKEQDKLTFCSQASYNGDTLTINNGKDIDDVNKQITAASYKYKGEGTVRQISTKASVSKSKYPKVLFIGDSITYGVAASAYQTGNSEYAYWGYATKLFEMDKIDGGNKSGEYNFTSLGTRGAGGNISVNYKGIEKTVRAACEGYSGWLLADILHHSNTLSFDQATWDSLGLGDGTGKDFTNVIAQRNKMCLANENNSIANPANGFFDNAKTGNVKFSIAKWLERYRTLDDNGNRLTLGNGTGTQITSDNINTHNVCTPTHVVVTMGRNDLSYCDENTFIQNMDMFIAQVKSELPNATIGISITPDDVGTMFPKRYNNIIDSLNVGERKFYSLASRLMTVYGNREAENIYLIPLYFVQPTAWGQPLYRVDMSESLLNVEGFQKDSFLKYRPLGVGASFHPGSQCHAAWGYQMYSWLKYVLSK